jgi:phosphate:Na+ symporter
LGINNVISLLGGVALFLFGMTLMGDGLKKVAGNKLEIILYKLTSTPLKGVLLGTGVTAVIQSSSATSVMVVGFVNSGMMQVRQAIGIVLGSILGTSITGWILCLSDISGSGWVSLLSTATLTGVVAVVGIVLRMFCKDLAKHHIGDILLGFAVLMYGMSSMSGAVAPLKDSAAFIELLTRFSNPLLGVLVGTVFTCILQSASAAVGILQALAITGTITFSVAFPITLGIAIGAAVPVLLSSLGASVKGKRTAYVYLLIDVIGAVVWGVVFYAVNAAVHFPFTDTTMTTVSIALLNTIFRFATVLLLTPMIPLLEKLVSFLFPDKASTGALADIDRLEERFLAHPALAIEQSRLAIDSMARQAQDNILSAFSLLDKFSDEQFAALQENEEAIDHYEDKLGTYLIKITSKELTPRQTADVSKYLHTISDLERISDHSLNIGETAQELYTKKIVFSPTGARELKVMLAAVTRILEITINAFLDNDVAAAYRVEPLEELIDNLCDEMKLHHIDRLQTGECTLNHGFAFNDLLTNCERVSDHCSNIAVAMIELESDSFDTHEYINSVMAMHSHSFDEYYSEYSKEFQI